MSSSTAKSRTLRALDTPFFVSGPASRAFRAHLEECPACDSPQLCSVALELLTDASLERTAAIVHKGASAAAA